MQSSRTVRTAVAHSRVTRSRATHGSTLRLPLGRKPFCNLIAIQLLSDGRAAFNLP